MPGTTQVSSIEIDCVFGGLHIVDKLASTGMSAFAVSVQPVEGCYVVNQQQPQAPIVLHSIQT